MSEPPVGSQPEPPVAAGGGRLSERNRVEAFSDGIFAIAITLLVLDLHAPTRPGGMAAQLREQWPTYFAYLASFAFIGVLWVNHHQVFARVRAVDGGLLWVNLGLLLASSVLPLPTAVLGAAFQDGTAGDLLAGVVLYAALAGLTAVMWLLIFGYLAGHPQLLVAHTPPGFFAAERRRAVLGIVSYAAAAAVALLSPTAALGICVALPVFYAITSSGWSRRARR